MSEIERLNEVLKLAFIKIGIYKKADMAEYLGYKSPYFSGVINGKEKLSDIFLKNISDKLGVNIDYILEGKGEMLKTGNIHVVGNSNLSNTGITGGDVVIGSDQEVKALKEKIKYLEKQLKDKDHIIATQVKTIQALDDAIQLLKKGV